MLGMQPGELAIQVPVLMERFMFILTQGIVFANCQEIVFGNMG